MNEINSAQGVLDSLRFQQESVSSNDELGQQEFLQLLVAQLRNQNPTEPQDGAEFLGQMAQFSSLDATQKMAASLSELSATLQSNQALQASSLVGRNVRIESNVANLDANGSIEGLVELPNGVSDLQISISNSRGELVTTMNLGSQAAGNVPFQWGGIDDNGEGVEPGLYRVVAQATVNNEATQFNTLVSANVDSVTVGSGSQGTILNLAGLGSIPLSQVKELQ